VIPRSNNSWKNILEDGSGCEWRRSSRNETESSNAVSADDDDVVKRIKELLENYVKPAVEMDGGAIQFKSYEDGKVNLSCRKL